MVLHQLLLQSSNPSVGHYSQCQQTLKPRCQPARLVNVRAVPQSDSNSSNSSSTDTPRRTVSSRALQVSKADTVVHHSAADPQRTEAETLSGPSTSGITAAWDATPSRLKIVGATAMSFVICNMDKVNMSVAIIPMAQDFGWSPSVSGIVQSAFFYGYMLTQLPSGLLSSKFGGRNVLPAGVALWSTATASVPLLASTIPGLCVSRALVGLGEAVAPSAAIDMVARAVPASERSRAVAFIFSGLHVGSIIGLLVAPVMINNFGWEAVFVSFGALGLVWVAWFESLLGELRRTDPVAIAALSGIAGSSAAEAAAQAEAEASSSSGADHHGALIDTNMHIPWRAFVRSRAVQALMWTHFCNNWFHYTMLAWLPTYFVDTLSVDLMHASQTALLPPLAGIAASSIAGPAADALVARGLPVATVRKLAQCVAFLVPSALLLAMGNPFIEESSNATIACITLSLGISSFSLAGLYCTHQDLSPKYAPALLGLTNTTGAIPGIIGVMTVGFLYDQFQDWEACLFAPSALLMLTGAAAYTFLCRNDPIDFDAQDDSPFEWEHRLKGLFAWGQKDE